MNIKFRAVIASKTFKIPLFASLIAALSGCASPSQMAANQAALDQCLTTIQSNHQTYLTTQNNLVASLKQVQTQLDEQRRVLQTNPRVIEKHISQVVCAAPVSEPKPFAAPPTPPLVEKQIVGLKEQVLFTGINVQVPTRINTNSAHSIMDARNIQMFERNSEEWVRFTFFNPETKEPLVLERKRIRFQTVNTATSPNERRPVVEMRFALGKLNQKGEFVLADRSNQEEPLLIGRNLLRDVMLVDVSGNNLAPVQRVEETEPTPQ
ncbi:MAG: ATP-dependent zinc protease [Cellvibrio sp.]